MRDPRAMRARAEDLRRDGRRIAVVPTMGALHEGHLTLLRAARARADIVILTIFVNPTQFGPNEDLAQYPRDEAGDIAKARTCGIDLAFCPEASAMYPPGAQTFVEVRELQKPLCGASRPGPLRRRRDDRQQAVPHHAAAPRGVRREGLPAARDHPAHGARPRLRHRDRRRADRPRGRTASRCRRATPTCRPSSARAALALSRGLAAAEAAVKAGERDAAKLVAAARAPIEAEPRARIDYVELRDADELSPVTTVSSGLPCSRWRCSSARRG